jgi:hypothetical protein
MAEATPAPDVVVVRSRIRGPEACVECVSLINIRPARGNRGMLVEDPQLRERIVAIGHELLGRGEPL